MVDKNAEIQALQGIATGLTAQSIGHRMHGLVFAAQGFTKLGDKYDTHAEEEMAWVEKFANRILDLGGELKIEGLPATPVHADIEEYLKSEKKVSEEGIAQVMELMPIFQQDLVAYEDMKAYLIDEDGDLQETNKDLDLIALIGKQNWLLQQL